ncbi:MAG: rhamnan synthesis F family protein [Eubacteriales bacterium]
MNRCGVVVLYDKEGIIDNYIFALLQELQTVANRIIVVVNGIVLPCYEEKIRAITDEIIIRPNIGYDGTAYKEVILDYFEQEELQQYDELVLCNDTFYGPFQPLKDIFESMDHTSGDFWGLLWADVWWGQFIATFFMVLRKAIVQSDSLAQFFHQMPEITDFITACTHFEYPLTTYLIERDYSYGTYATQQEGMLYRYPMESIGTGLDILKKKSFAPKYYKQGALLNTLRYIHEKTIYDINLILDSVNRIYECGITKEQVLADPYSSSYPAVGAEGEQVTPELELRKWIESEDVIYLYGAGFYTSVFLYKYKEYRGRIAGIVVSDGHLVEHTYEGYEVLEYSELIRRSKGVNMPILVTVQYPEQLGIEDLLGEGERVCYLFG